MSDVEKIREGFIRENYVSPEEDAATLVALRELAALVAERDALADALHRVQKNATAWHGNEGLGTGHARALAVIAEWAMDALADSGAALAVGEAPERAVERTQE